MTKPFSLQTVLELMQARADSATQALARLIANERDAKNKLDMLQQYRDEYATRFTLAAQTGSPEANGTTIRNSSTVLTKPSTHNVSPLHNKSAIPWLARGLGKNNKPNSKPSTRSRIATLLARTPRNRSGNKKSKTNSPLALSKTKSRYSSVCHKKPPGTTCWYRYCSQLGNTCH